jgi:hypothetical protein
MSIIQRAPDCISVLCQEARLWRYVQYCESNFTIIHNTSGVRALVRNRLPLRTLIENSGSQTEGVTGFVAGGTTGRLSWSCPSPNEASRRHDLHRLERPWFVKIMQLMTNSVILSAYETTVVGKATVKCLLQRAGPILLLLEVAKKQWRRKVTPRNMTASC